MKKKKKIYIFFKRHFMPFLCLGILVVRIGHSLMKFWQFQSYEKSLFYFLPPFPATFTSSC